MTKIAAVKTVNSSTALWFDAGDLEINVNDNVVVETARGTEFGTLAEEVFEATDKQIKNLKSELKPVIRVANSDDLIQADEMAVKSKDAFPIFKKLAAETNKDMNPISVDYLFDGKKAVFYFSAPERQDFRDLVKKLSSEFHIRVDMRQINEREKAAKVSGIGFCGQELCCARLGRCPKHVSIKQAKAQGLALNPENISGMCGKLLCCLDYEYEEYKVFVDKAPKLKAKVSTPDGDAVVVDVNMPKERIEVKMVDSEKRVKVPLSAMEIDKSYAKKIGNNTGNVRPNKIGKDAWIEAQNESNEFNLESVYTSTTLQGSEKLATGVVKTLPGAKRRERKINNENAGKSHKQNSKINKSKKQKTNNKSRDNAKHANVYENMNGTTTRRRSRKIGGGNIRPGQNSSGSNSKK